jgi:Mg/Co/Ni transporter MgtE
MAAHDLAPILDRVDDDVEADIVQDLPREQAEELLPLLEDRQVVEQLLTHEEESAGGLMSPDVLALQRDWTVDQTIDFLRRQKPDAEHPYYLYVVDIEDWEAIGRAHGEVFAAVRPATTMVEVSRLISPEMRVEIEAEAIVGSAPGT